MEDNIPNKNLSKRAQMLQAASPYVSEEYRNYLDVIVGTEELQCNMRQISDRNNPFFKNRKKGESDLHTNAINTNPMGSLTNMFQGFDMIGLLGAIKDFFDDKERKMIEQILNMMQMFKMVEMYQQMMQMQKVSNMFNQEENFDEPVQEEKLQNEETQQQNTNPFNNDMMMEMLKMQMPPEQRNMIDSMMPMMNMMGNMNSNNSSPKEEDSPNEGEEMNNNPEYNYDNVYSFEEKYKQNPDQIMHAASAETKQFSDNESSMDSSNQSPEEIE